jgi:hypothetical protein
MEVAVNLMTGLAVGLSIVVGAAVLLSVVALHLLSRQPQERTGPDVIGYNTKDVGQK